MLNATSGGFIAAFFYHRHFCAIITIRRWQKKIRKIRCNVGGAIRRWCNLPNPNNVYDSLVTPVVTTKVAQNLDKAHISTRHQQQQKS